MMFHHHPHDDTLMGYAAGVLDEAFAMVVNCHLQFCVECRRRVRQLEQLGSVLLEDMPGEQLSAGFEHRVMAAFAAEFGHKTGHEPQIAHPSRPQMPNPQTAHGASTLYGSDAAYVPIAPTLLDAGDHRIMPGPLARMTGLVRETIPWRASSNGVRSVSVPVVKSPNSMLHFLALDPGVTLEPEQHHGGHFILVLWGSYESEIGRVERGDFHEVDAETTHFFKAGHEEGVVCVVATDAVAKDNHLWIA